MTFVPVIPGQGLSGWRFLERTFDSQNDAFQKSPQITRDVDYFAEQIANIQSPEDLVNDRRLLNVALGAFGLQDDINNRFFIKTVLEEGTLAPDALANKLTDDRYKDLAKAFGFGDLGLPRTGLTGFADEITSLYRTQQFEIAVGEIDDSMRQALFAQRQIPELVASSGSDTTKWFKILGTPPLRAVFEGALGLPSSIGQLDIDRQVEDFKDRARSVFGSDTVSQFSEPETQDRLIQQFLVRAQLDQTSSLSVGSIALTLLQSNPLTN